MKKSLLLLLIICSITVGHSQRKKLTIRKQAETDTVFKNGSEVNIGTLNIQKQENLAVLAKVWGFLKYHHPKVANGAYKWDYELFRIVEKVSNASNTAQRDEVLSNWITSLGPVNPCTRCGTALENVEIKPDHGWMRTQVNSEVLFEQLSNVMKNRNQGSSQYIAMSPGVGNPVFKNEESYKEMSYPDEGYRLLSLFRYWNMIHYYFPYKDIIDKDWNEVLTEYIPKVLAASNELEYERTMKLLIGEVQDTHANLWGGGDQLDAEKGNKYPPVHVRYAENKLVVVDYYNPEMKSKIGLEVGDVITKINGKSVATITKGKLLQYPASNIPSKLRDIGHDILRSNDTQLELTLTRNGSELNKTLPLFDKDSLDTYRWYRRDTVSKSYKMLPNNIGYIFLGNIKKEDVEEIKTQFKNTKGIIVDIRNYPSDFVVFSLGEFFAPKGSEFVKFTTGSLSTPGEFRFGQTLKVGSKSKDKVYQGQVIVIVNELTQSSAEYHSMAFRSGPNTTVIGSTTAGADGNVSRIDLPGGLRTMISGIGVFYPDGTPTQRIGIVPDITIAPTVKGIREGRDELLEKAVQLILGFKD